MRKRKEKTAVEKAVEVLFEGGVDSTAILGHMPTPIVKTIKQLKMRRGIELYYPVAAQSVLLV